MPDTPFKSMTREGNGLPKSLRHLPSLLEAMDATTWHSRKTTRCEKCGGHLRAGDWPWCRGAGHAGDHDR